MGGSALGWSSSDEYTRVIGQRAGEVGVRAVARSAQARKAVSRGCVGWRLRIYRDLRVRSSRVSRAADLGCRAGEAGEAAVQRGGAARAVPLRRRQGCGEDRGCCSAISLVRLRSRFRRLIPVMSVEIGKLRSSGGVREFLRRHATGASGLSVTRVPLRRRLRGSRAFKGEIPRPLTACERV